VAQFLSTIPISPNQFDLPKNSPYDGYPRHFASGNINHVLWGGNNLLQYFDSCEFPLQSANILYISFSLVNRTSFQKLTAVGKKFSSN
jgi:hypothetical protein